MMGMKYNDWYSNFKIHYNANKLTFLLFIEFNGKMLTSFVIIGMVCIKILTFITMQIN